MSCACWQSIGSIVQLQLDVFRARADLARPSAGLVDAVVAGQPMIAAQLLGVAVGAPAATVATPPAENHVRGADLAAVYQQTGQWPLRVDVLWRATAPQPTDPFLAAIELIVSVRTDALDSHPELRVQSVIPASEVLALPASDPTEPSSLAAAAPQTIGPQDDIAGLLFRLPGTEHTYLEMVHPADRQPDELSRCDAGSGPWRIVHPLFCTRLEKGVMLRARVRGVLLSRRDDAAAAARCYAAFAAADPPLDAC
jgi:hypothetical protein